MRSRWTMGFPRIFVGPAPRWFVAACVSMVLCVWLAPAAVAGQAGTLDPTFSDDGLVATNFTAGLDFAYDVAISATDGSIVAAGQAGGSGGRFALARYTSDGTLDLSFGLGGKVLTNFTSGFDAAYGVGIQADGKIVAAGTATGRGGRIALARYDAAGDLDPTFGGDGKVITNLTPGDDFAWTLAIQPVDQKIVVAGGAGGSGERFMLARYDTDGSPDDGFSGDGAVFTDFTRAYDYVDAITIQDDGSIVAAGATNYYGSSPRFAVARYAASGSLDDTFSGDGKLTTNFPEGMAWAFAVAIQMDDDIVVAGQAGTKMAAARYDASGVLDPTFGGDGRVTTNFTRGEDYADEVMIQGDGAIVLVGSANYFGDDARFALARFTGGGSLDTSFGGDGKVTTNPSTGVDWALGALLQPADGRIVVAGRTKGSGGRFAVARYLVA